MAVFCTNCGSPINEGAGFCPNCGTRVGAKAQAAPQPAQVAQPGAMAPRSGSPLMKVLLIVLLVIVGLAGVYKLWERPMLPAPGRAIHCTPHPLEK